MNLSKNETKELNCGKPLPDMTWK